MELTKIPDWYNQLIEDLSDLVVENEFNLRIALIEYYHQLGSRIVVEDDNIEKDTTYGKQIVQHIAKSIGKSERTVHYAIKFAKQFPDLSELTEGKNITWTHIVRKYLTTDAEKIIEEIPDPNFVEKQIIKYAKALSERAEIKGDNIVIKLPRKWD